MDSAAAARANKQDAVARYFQIAEKGSSYRQEIIGGITTFLAMSYILFVNPQILAAAGMPEAPMFVATALSAVVGCLFMAFIAHYPVGQAPSMGVNAYFAFTVVLTMGESWQNALVASMIAGILFVLLTAIKVREKILDAIPRDLKLSIACGIGIFIAFVGLQSSGIVVGSDDTLVKMGSLTEPATIISIVGLIFIVVLKLWNVRGAILLGMIAAAVFGMFIGVIDYPHKLVGSIPSIKPLFGVSITHIFEHPDQFFSLNMLVAVMTFLFLSFFDTAGTLIGIAEHAGLMEGNRIKREGRALFADSASIVTGSIFGTSPTNAYIESTTGIDAGAKTGFAPVVTAVLFAVALLFSPLLLVVTPNVTAPAMIMVGTLMLSKLNEIDWKRVEIALPAFATMTMMALTYNIANGIAMGLTLYPLTMIASGRRKDIEPTMYPVALICLLYFIFLAV